MVANELPEESTLAIVPKTDTELVLMSAEKIVADQWQGHLFNLANAYGFIPLNKQNPEQWDVKALTALFSEDQQVILKPLTVTRHLALMHGVAGKGLLVKLWDLWKSGEWILMRPDGMTDDEWKFADFAEVTLQGTNNTSADYHRKLAWIVERVFNYVAVRTIADENGERVTPLYLVNRFGPLELVRFSQFFSAKPTEDEIKAMLKEAFESEDVAATVQHHINKKTRNTIGTEGNFFYVKNLSNGGKSFQIQLDDPKLANKVEKFLQKYGEPRFLTQQDEDNED